VQLPFPAGKQSIRFVIPSLQTLALYTQALLTHRRTPLEARFTNVVWRRIAQ